MSKAIEDVISEKVAKSLLAGVDVDAIIAKKVGKLETVVEQIVDEAIKSMKKIYSERAQDLIYDNDKITDMLDKAFEQMVAAKLGFEKKGKKARKN